MNVGCIAGPLNDQAEVIDQEAQLAAHDPTGVGFPFLANLAVAATFSARMDELDTVTINDAQQRGFSQETLRMPLVGVEQPIQPGSFRQLGEQRAMIPLQPAEKGAIAYPFKRKSRARVTTSLG